MGTQYVTQEKEGKFEARETQEQNECVPAACRRHELHQQVPATRRDTMSNSPADAADALEEASRNTVEPLLFPDEEDALMCTADAACLELESWVGRAPADALDVVRAGTVRADAWEYIPDDAEELAAKVDTLLPLAVTAGDVIFAASRNDCTVDRDADLGSITLEADDGAEASTRAAGGLDSFGGGSAGTKHQEWPNKRRRWKVSETDGALMRRAKTNKHF